MSTTRARAWVISALLLSACAQQDLPTEASAQDTPDRVQERDDVHEDSDVHLASDASVERAESTQDAALNLPEADIAQSEDIDENDVSDIDVLSVEDSVTDNEITEEGDADAAESIPQSCMSFDSPQVMGQLPPSITEASGLALSAIEPNVLWLHNDSGDQARIYAIESSGERLATVTLEGSYAYDWEDMAQGPCSADAPNSSCLYIGDIGDNQSKRTYIKVHRVPEPDIALGDHTIAREDYDTMTLVYPDSPRDCEALVVDEHAHIYLLSKEWENPIFRLYASPYLAGAELAPLQMLSEHDISELGGTASIVTAASYSPTLRRLLVRTYTAAFEYHLGPDKSLAELSWSSAYNVPVANEGQGEAVAHGPGGFWHVSEGKEPPIWFVACQ